MDRVVGPRRLQLRQTQLTGLIVASALITLDGTATTIALPAIGRDLSASIARLQWVANAPLLMLAAMLLPAGMLADRYGRIRLMRVGLIGFVAASIGCAIARSDVGLIGAKFLQGAGSALVLPTALAVLRGVETEAEQRTRTFGVWAAWTGAASAAGPLMAGVLIDLWSWRIVFVPSAAAGVLAALLLGAESGTETPACAGPVPGTATLALMAVIGGVSYLLMQGPATGLQDARMALPAVLAATGAVVLVRDRHRDALFPRELLTARNCLPANMTTFALYFGMFGLSFLVVLYVQQVLRLLIWPSVRISCFCTASRWAKCFIAWRSVRCAAYRAKSVCFRSLRWAVRDHPTWTQSSGIPMTPAMT